MIATATSRGFELTSCAYSVGPFGDVFRSTGGEAVLKGKAVDLFSLRFTKLCLFEGLSAHTQMARPVDAPLNHRLTFQC